MTELEVLNRLSDELDLLKKHIDLLKSPTTSEWDVCNSTQHLPFACAGVLAALGIFSELQGKSFLAQVQEEKTRQVEVLRSGGKNGF